MRVNRSRTWYQVARRRVLSSYWCITGGRARGEGGWGAEDMDDVWRCRGSGAFDETGDSGRGSMPNCSDFIYGDWVLVMEVMYRLGSSGGGYVGVVLILGGNGQSPNVLCVN